MSSPALQTKIAKARTFAPNELPKARLCAQVVLAAVEGEDALKAALKALQEGAGRNWIAIHALQYMSGRRGQFALECATAQEQPQLYLAHLVAKQVCSANGLGAVSPPDGTDAAKFKSLVFAAQTHLK